MKWDKILLMPELASEHGAALDRVSGLVHVLMLILFVFWGAVFVYTLVRFRKSRNPKADYAGVKSHSSTYLEVAVAIAEAFILIAFAFPLWADRIEEFPPEDDAIVVRVVAEQFAWNIHYPGPDGEFGTTKPELVNTETNSIGLDLEDPKAKDDIVTLNQLHLPVNRDVIVHLSSKDVIHSFFLPEMRVKQDAIPGIFSPLWFKPIVTTEEMREIKKEAGFVSKDGIPWDYQIACAQLCGITHFRMVGYMTIHTQEDFDAWLAEKAKELEAAGEVDSFFM